MRSVTQGDVIRAEAKDIPRIFQVNKFLFHFFKRFVYIVCLHLQILYAGEGESRKPEDNIGNESIASVVSGNVVMNKSNSGKFVYIFCLHFTTKLFS